MTSSLHELDGAGPMLADPVAGAAWQKTCNPRMPALTSSIMPTTSFFEEGIVELPSPCVGLIEQ
jgi:hypothetical protein